jgi:sarcosine oxidase
VNREYKYIVVGLGGIGSAIAYWLSRRAKDVLGLEQFELGHDRGASQDHSRIIRLSYHTPYYVRLAVESYKAWRVLEKDTKKTVLVKTGGLDFGPKKSALPLNLYAESMREVGVKYEELTADQIESRWPQFKLDAGIHGLYQEDGGLIAASIACNLMRKKARERGALLLDNTPVTSIRSVKGEVRVSVEGTEFTGEKLFLATDAWTNKLLKNVGITLPLTITQEQVTYFNSPCPDEFVIGKFPMWIWLDEPSFYGFPVFGMPGPKAGLDVGGDETTPEDRTFQTNLRAYRAVEEFLTKYIPLAVGKEIGTKTCLYTMPPDREFILDRVPGHENVFVALGAAHGFKFASLFGKILSELAIDGKTDLDISPFSITRPILTDPNPKKNFLL